MNFPAEALTDVPQGSGPLNIMGRGALVFTAKVGAGGLIDHILGSTDLARGNVTLEMTRPT